MKEFFGISIDTERLPRHVAIIMDGNGRWAQNRCMPRVMGHEKGFAALKSLIEFNKEVGVPFISVFAFSTENWNRPQKEIQSLMGLAKKTIKEYTQLLLDNDVKLVISGTRKGLEPELVELIEDAESKTSKCSSYVFNTAFNYGSRKEILDATKKIVADVKENRLSLSDLDEKKFAEYLYQPGIPDVDLLIRSSGELRLSNFLLWQNAYSEFYFTDTLWPDFDGKEFIMAIQEYQSRKRRYGSL